MVNFGIVKSQVSKMLGEHYLNNEYSTAENVYREYMRTIRQSPILMLEYVVFKNLERKGILREAAYKYIDDNIALLKNYSRKDIINENKKLAKFHQNVSLSWEDKIMFENIQTLVLESAGGNKFVSINKLHDSLSFIMESISVNAATSEESEDTDADAILEGFNLEHTYKTAYKLFDDKYQELNENDRSLLKVLHETDEAGFFDEMKKRVIEVVKAKTQDLELQKQVVTEIESRTYNAETLAEDVAELYELIS